MGDQDTFTAQQTPKLEGIHPTPQIQGQVLAGHVRPIQERIEFESIREEYLHLFMEYIDFLKTPLKSQIQAASGYHKVAIPDGEESFLSRIIQNKAILADHGFEYKAKSNIDWESSVTTVDIKELMHIRGLSIKRSVNPSPEEVVITVNDYDQGYLEYGFNSNKYPK